MKFLSVFWIFGLVLLIHSNNTALSQDGHNYIKHYDPEIGNIDKRITGIVQDNKDIMFYTTTRGVMSYDGAQWKLIRTLSTPLCIASNPKEGVLYIGCEGDFGYLKVNSKGYYRYYSLGKSDSKIGNITQVIILGDIVYYYGENVLFAYSINSNEIEHIWRPNEDKLFQGIFSFQKTIYINRINIGLFKLVGGNFNLVENSEMFSRTKIKVFIPLNSKKVILYTNNSDGYIYDGLQFKKQKNSVIDYLKENTITCGVNLGYDKYALGTLTGGCVIVEKKTAKPISIMNYQNGLSDDEVFSLGSDIHGGVWIAHEIGLSRLDFELPIKQYSSYPGLDGYIISSKILNGKNYVATNQGLFVLTKLSIDEKKIYIKGNKKVKSPPASLGENVTSQTNSLSFSDSLSIENSTSNLVIESEDLKKQKNDKKNNKKNEKKKKRLNKKSNKNENSEDDKNSYIAINNDEYLPQELPNLGCIPCAPCDKRDVSSYYIQHTLVHGYKKIDGLEGKCKDMVIFKGALLAMTNTTLYKINNNIAKQVVSNHMLNTIHISPNMENIYFIGTDKGIIARNNEKELWSIKNLYASIHSIQQDEYNNLWLGCEKSVIKIELNDRGLPGRQTYYPLNIGFSEEIEVRIITGNIYFFSSDRVFLYLEENNDIVEIDNFKDIEIDGFFKLINSDDGYTWINSGQGWLGIPEDRNKEIKDISYLKVLNKIRHIYLDGSNKIWVTDGDNNLYKINNNQDYPHKNHTTLSLSSVSGSKHELYSLVDIQLKHDHSGIEVNFASPHFLNEQNVEYQYLLEGEMDDWSEWNNNNSVHFPFVPIGNYELKIRSKNIFDKLTDEIHVPIVVSPPYWLTWKFYVMEISVIFTLLLMSILFNTKREESWVSKSLLLLTIIIIFKFLLEFIHSFIHANPVVDFIISVFMVFVILKIEKIAVEGVVKLCRNIRIIQLNKNKKD